MPTLSIFQLFLLALVRFVNFSDFSNVHETSNDTFSPKR